MKNEIVLTRPFETTTTPKFGVVDAETCQLMATFCSLSRAINQRDLWRKVGKFDVVTL